MQPFIRSFANLGVAATALAIVAACKPVNPSAHYFAELRAADAALLHPPGTPVCAPAPGVPAPDPKRQKSRHGDKTSTAHAQDKTAHGGADEEAQIRDQAPATQDKSGKSATSKPQIMPLPSEEKHQPQPPVADGVAQRAGSPDSGVRDTAAQTSPRDTAGHEFGASSEVQQLIRERDCYRDAEVRVRRQLERLQKHTARLLHALRPPRGRGSLPPE